MIISPEERAHDLADMVAHWQLSEVAKKAKEENKTVKVNLHSFYHKYYTELLNIFKQDALFNEDLK
ncbi:MAG: hypothetical protein LIO71_08415 [Ruminococcus sp.]|nr:hypothetical protein [Ruminococcus sp.]MCD7800208.1 hypothetical protein [Ruminococcus sp.]